MAVHTSAIHTLYKGGGKVEEKSKSVLFIMEETFGTKNRAEAFYEALAPYFEELAELKIEQWGSEKE